MKEKYELKPLSQDELISHNGGVIGTVAAAITILGGVTMLAYGAGYIYGKYLCECE